jgi:hypothetical protein
MFHFHNKRGCNKKSLLALGIGNQYKKGLEMGKFETWILACRQYLYIG